MEHVRAEQETIQGYVEEISKVAATLESQGDDGQARQEEFKQLIDRFERVENPIYVHMAKVMMSFLPGLFVGGGLSVSL